MGAAKCMVPGVLMWSCGSGACAGGTRLKIWVQKSGDKMQNEKFF